MVDWWTGAAGAVIGGVLGALAGSAFPLLWAWRARRIERAGEIAAMQDELRHAHAAMTALRTAGIPAPLYHLPLTTFERGLPKLIGEGKLKELEIGALVEYEMRAQELNRGLDIAVQVSAGNMSFPGNFATLEGLHGRNAGKVKHILDEKRPQLGDMTVFEAAEAALERLSRKNGGTDMKKLRSDWLAIAALVISLLAVGFTALQWREARELRRQQFDSTLEFDIDTQLGQHVAGISLKNLGPGIARVNSVTYYLDGRALDEPADALDHAKLDSNRDQGVDLDRGDSVGAGEVIPLVRYPIRRHDEEDLARSLFEDHLQIAVKYCSANGNCARACTSRGKCPE